MTKLKDKINEKKLSDAVALFTKLMQYRTILNNHSIVANSPIPRNKQKKHGQLVADWIVKVQNIEAELDKLFTKLRKAEKTEFTARCKQLYQ